MKKVFKVLYVTTISDTINSFLIPHIKMLIDNGYSVDCACSINKEIDEELIKAGVKVYDIPFSRNPIKLSNIRAYKDLVEIQDKNRYDMIHVHTPVAAFWARFLKIKFKGLKVIYTAHGFHFYKGAPLKNWMIYYIAEKITAKLTDVIITINEEDYKLACRKFKTSSNKVYKVSGVGVEIEEYNRRYLNKDEYRRKFNLKSNDFAISVIGELSKRKNQMQIILAMDKICRYNNKIKVLIIGSGNDQEKLEKEIKKRNLSKNVILLGYRDDIPEILSCSQAVGLFSLQEGLPRCLLEALCAEKAIICTDIRGNNELVKKDYNGILVGINDIEATKDAIIKLYENKELNHKYGKNSRQKVKDYSINSVLEEMKEIYNIVTKCSLV